MSDGFPWRSCADAFLFRDEVVGDGDRSLSVLLVCGRDRKTHEFLIQLIRETRALWTVKRVEQWIVVPGPDGERLR